jgi:hypothetical protein
MNAFHAHARRTFMLAAIGVALALPAHAQRAFLSPDEGVEALVRAFGSQQTDPARIAVVLGPDWRKAVPDDIDRADVDAFIARYRERHTFAFDDKGRSVLTVGKDGWTFPVPLTKGRDGWRFDLAAGADEIRARHIGRNELDVEQALRAYNDAQNDYARKDRDGDGVLEYAQKIFSTAGKHDGLYWADDTKGDISPLGPLFGNDTQRTDYLGYHYRILASQGASAPGGAFDYRLGDNMSRGFALVAWPARYGESGITSFMISHDGVVFERDLGKDGDAIARAMASFDPDSGWTTAGDAKR